MNDCLLLPSPSTKGEILLRSPDDRLRGLALSLRGRCCLNGYLMTATRAEKVEALYRGGFVAVRMVAGFRYVHRDGGKTLRLSQALALSRLTGVDMGAAGGKAGF